VISPETLLPAAILAGAYILGSVPFAYVITKSATGKDIRKFGSKNVGATNVARTAGKLLALVVLCLDFLKGAVPVILARHWTGSDFWAGAAGFSAMLGHSYPIFLGLRGGKSVATGCGAFFVLSPPAMLASVVLFIITASIFRIVAIGSIVAAASFPFFAWFFKNDPGIILWGAISASLIILRHKTNLMEFGKRLNQQKEKMRSV
jgi:acyl phosphate:glycerol-3-phosphate acyltransferase